jgi:hypothetical protein
MQEGTYLRDGQLSPFLRGATAYHKALGSRTIIERKEVVKQMGQRYFQIHPAVDFALSGRREPVVVRALDFTVPQPGFSRVYLRVTGVTTGTPFNYEGNVYLVPQDVEFQPRDPAFREMHFADLFTILQTPGHLTPAGSVEPDSLGETEIVVDLTKQLQSLAQSHAGETWIAIVALAVNTPKESEEALAARVLPAGSSLDEFLNFAGMSLESE